jgi:hypothetical protein
MIFILHQKISTCMKLNLTTMKKILILGLFLFFGLAMKGFSQTVYASAKGEKYHTADCKLSGDADGMTLAAAKKAGKGPCGICKPDQHAKDKLVQCSGKTADGTKCKRMTSAKSGKCYQHSSK